MIRRLYLALPGGPVGRTILAVIIVSALIAGLVLLYDWLGGLLLDSGGTIG